MSLSSSSSSSSCFSLGLHFFSISSFISLFKSGFLTPTRMTKCPLLGPLLSPVGSFLILLRRLHSDLFSPQLGISGSLDSSRGKWQPRNPQSYQWGGLKKSLYIYIHPLKECISNQYLSMSDCQILGMLETEREREQLSLVERGHYSGLWNVKYPHWHWDVFCLLLAGSLWHKIRFFYCFSSN